MTLPRRPVLDRLLTGRTARRSAASAPADRPGEFALSAGSIEWSIEAHSLLVDSSAITGRNRFATFPDTHRTQTPVRAAMTLPEDLTDLRQEDRRQ